MYRDRLTFLGSKERLLKAISKHGGTLIQPQQFSIVWKSKHYKALSRLSFYFQCAYEKTASGFEITYRILPTFATALKVLFIIGLLIVLAFTSGKSTSVPVCAVAVALLAGNIYTQINRCIKEFKLTFQVQTDQRHEK